MGGVLVAAWAGVYADALPFVGCELGEYLVVEVDERAQQLLGRVELDREPALGEVDLHVVRTTVQGAADVGGRLANEVGEECLFGVVVQAVLGVEQAQRGRGDHGLLDRDVRVAQRRGQVAIGVVGVAEGAGGEPGQLSGVTVCERDHRPVRRERRQPGDGVGREAGLGLFAVGDDW